MNYERGNITIITISFLKIFHREATQISELRALTAVPENPGLTASTYKAAYNYLELQF